MFGQPQPFYPMPGMMQQPFGGVLQGGQMQPTPQPNSAPNPQQMQQFAGNLNNMNQQLGQYQLQAANGLSPNLAPQQSPYDGSAAAKAMGIPWPPPGQMQAQPAAFQPQGFGGMRPQMSLPPMPGLQQPAPQPGLGMLGNAIMQNAGRNFRQR